MKKQMKMMISIMIISVMLVVAIPLAYATGNNFSVILTAQNTVKRGETVEVTVELDAFTGTGKGINSFMGDLEYDETKLSIESSQIVAQNGWDTPMYENDKVLTAKGSMVTAKEAIMKMTFTVKSDAVLGETTITIKNAEAANDDNDFIGEDGTITIEIVEETTPPADDGNGDVQNPPADDGNDDGQNPPADDGKDDGQNPPADDGKDDVQNPPADDGKDDGQTPSTDDKKEEGKDNTVADKEYDKAGTGTIISLATAIVAVIAIIMYRKNKKYQDII
ncbi:MAG: hypothetical protein IJE68_02530 [Clostridia bacterium]|nr:hypothetical protein [Clostridia bacterium]